MTSEQVMSHFRAERARLQAESDDRARLYVGRVMGRWEEQEERRMHQQMVQRRTEHLLQGMRASAQAAIVAARARISAQQGVRCSWIPVVLVAC